MKNLLLIFLLSFSLASSNLFAQEEMQISKNAVSLDLIPFDQLYSINYERALIVGSKFAVVPKIGFYRRTNLNSFNTGVDFVYGKSKHFLEAGLNVKMSRGFTVKGDANSEKMYLNYAFEPRIGYRFQKNKEGIFFRAAVRNPYLEVITLRNREDEIIRDYRYEFRKISGIFLFPSFGLGYSF